MSKPQATYSQPTFQEQSMSTQTVLALGENTTSDNVRTIAVGLAALGCGLNAGVFYAFSTFVMDGLRRASDSAGLAAMQGINESAPRAPFMILFLGTVGLCVAAMVARPTVPVFVGSALYLVGVIGVTAAANIPLNNQLVPLDPTAADSVAVWRHFLSSWLPWNHVRTAAGALAAAAFTWQLARGR
ncbi:MAG TPA: anthrone oxygenase family protein [Nocardioides sp.]|jgi:uncharacterized membrane protein